MCKHIAVIGEYKAGFRPHDDLNRVLEILKDDYKFTYEWLETERIVEGCMEKYDGIWSAPGSPFNSLDGALYAVKYARENDIPHLGTCAGFQHTIIEYARNVLMFEGANHEEYDSDASMLFIHKMLCSLAGKTMSLIVEEHSKAYNCYKRRTVEEDYYCNFGINPDFVQYIEASDFCISGRDKKGDIRIVELPKLKFFMATLFVPQSRFTKEEPHQIIVEFVKSVCS